MVIVVVVIVIMLLMRIMDVVFSVIYISAGFKLQEDGKRTNSDVLTFVSDSGEPTKPAPVS